VHAAGFTNLHSKVSRIVTEADWTHWKRQDFIPYLAVVSESFETKHTIIGSDWPVCTLSGTYSRVMRIAAHVQLPSRDDQKNVCGANAKRFYELQD
jgi:L-fucono-1,5-lactonase